MHRHSVRWLHTTLLSFVSVEPLAAKKLDTLTLLSSFSQFKMKTRYLLADISLSLHNLFCNCFKAKSLSGIVQCVRSTRKFSPYVASTNSAHDMILTFSFHLEDPLWSYEIDYCMNSIILLVFYLVHVTFFFCIVIYI